MLILMSTWIILKNFLKKIADKKSFYRFLKDGTNNDKGEKLDGHVTDETYLTSIKTWNRFNMKNMIDYHDLYLKKDVLLLADVFQKFTRPVSH